MKVVLELEEHDARMIGAMIVLSRTLLTDKQAMLLGPLFFSDDTLSILTSTLGLLAGSIKRSDTPSNYNEFESKVIANLNRIIALLQALFTATDRDLVATHTNWLNPKG
jgi:hypothetical protein